MKEFFHWIWQHLHVITPYVLKGVWALVVLVLGLLILRLLLKPLQALLSVSEWDETAKNFLFRSARTVGRIFVVIIALSAAGVDVAPLIAGIGVTGFVIGFALKDTLANFAAGVMLLFYRPFEKGDYVEILGGKVKGKIHAIDVPATIVVTEDGKEVFVPNAKIWGDFIVNHRNKG